MSSLDNDPKQTAPVLQVYTCTFMGYLPRTLANFRVPLPW